MERVRINGKAWSVGLHWEYSIGSRFTNRKSLLATAQSLDESFDAAAKNPLKNGVQYGFGCVGANWPNYAAAPVLAACLDVGESFLGLFHLLTSEGQDCWWLHLRINQQIAMEGDHVFYDEADAQSALAILQEVSGLDTTVCETPEASELWIAERLHVSFLDKYLLETSLLRNLNTWASRGTIYRITAVTLLSILAVGSGIFWKMYADEAAWEAARQARFAKLQRQSDLEHHPEKFFTMAWQTAPLALDMAAGSLPVLMGLPLSAHGWELEKVVCNGKNVNIAWRHADGADFVLLPDGAHLDEKDMRTARATFPIAAIAVNRPDGTGTNHTVLLTRSEATGLLSEVTQATSTKLKPLHFGAQERRTIEKTTVVAPWHMATWELSSIPDLLMDAQATPDGGGLFELLSEIPGLTLDAITYANGTWSIKGRIYAKH